MFQMQIRQFVSKDSFFACVSLCPVCSLCSKLSETAFNSMIVKYVAAIARIVIANDIWNVFTLYSSIKPSLLVDPAILISTSSEGKHLMLEKFEYTSDIDISS